MTAPRATYRLQLRHGVTLDDAVDIVAYVADLGVSHLYLSPVLTAARGSTHGYDVIDPTSVDPALGGVDALRRLARAARDVGLGLVLDIVPNHVALVSPANVWWWDVLARGPDSDHAATFDITWRTGPTGLPTVLVPSLGRPLIDEIVDGDDLVLDHDDGWRVAYHEHAWPVREGSLDEAGLDPTDVEETLAAVAGDRGRLLSVLMRQHYELADWRRANGELNYRRFFDVTTLGGVRVEEAGVFERTHGTVLDLVGDGTIDGLRLDHPDGLWDPVGYFERLRARAPDAWIVAEKILESGEARRTSWPIDGTVGYAFTNAVLGLFVDPRGIPVFDRMHAAVTGRPDGFAATVETAKRQILDELFTSELDRLTTLLERIVGGLGIVTTTAAVHAALTELLVAFPVYRTYLRPGRPVAEEDRHALTIAMAQARVRLTDDEVLDALREVVGLDPDTGTVADDPDVAEFLGRFQQLTGPVMAKGVEDTAFYRYLRFVAVNEVGGDPGEPHTTLGTFHQANVVRAQRFPATMLTLGTHDTKRSADVRARLATLSELPDEWVEAVTEWRALARRHHGGVGPSPDHEYLILQTLVGTWPITPDRLADYAIKAAREGKRETHWIGGDAEYEADLAAFARALLDDAPFVASLEAFVERIREPGRLTSLSQTLLELTSPGVPDVYQGSELWDLALVDPDNRRPVDFPRRARLLAGLRWDTEPEDVLAGFDAGMPKLWVHHQALTVRSQRPDAFGANGGYEPLWARGSHADHVVAFVRGGDVVTVAPCRVVALGGTFLAWDWGDTTLDLPAGRWRDVMAGTIHDGATPQPLSRLLNRFPVGLLVREDGSAATA